MGEQREGGAPGGDEKRERTCVMTALNVNGAQAYRRRVTRARGHEDIHKDEGLTSVASNKVAGICTMFQAARAGYMLLGDTHVREGEEARELQKAITQHLPSVCTHVVGPISNRQGGLVVMWDAQQWKYEHVKEVEKGRIAVGRLERAGEPRGGA